MLASHAQAPAAQAAGRAGAVPLRPRSPFMAISPIRPAHSSPAQRSPSPTPSGNPIRTITADAGGAYEARGLAPGSYTVKAEFEGFAPFSSQPLAIAAGQAKRVDIAMAIQAEQQNIVVTDESPTVNVEASGNSNAIVLKGKDLDALSDDPDELSNELSALAGPSAGPNGGQIFIDGFSGGQLPPKSAIREIRINQNPFSAEFDRLGYGRIEILTKPGTDKLHGQFFVMGNDNVFNTANPFVAKNSAGQTVSNALPPYYSYQFNGTLSGAISKTASYFVSAERRNIENVNSWQIPEAVLLQDPSLPFDPASNPYVAVPYDVSLLNLRIRNNIVRAYRLATRRQEYVHRSLRLLE